MDREIGGIEERRCAKGGKIVSISVYTKAGFTDLYAVQICKVTLA